MNLQDTTEAALVALLDKSDVEHIEFLSTRRISKAYKCHNPKCDLEKYESLADLAERLWKLACEHAELSNAMDEIYPIKSCFNGPETRCRFYQWWLFDTTSIHRIVAALIALRRSGVEAL